MRFYVVVGCLVVSLIVFFAAWPLWRYFEKRENQALNADERSQWGSWANRAYTTLLISLVATLIFAVALLIMTAPRNP